MQVLGGVECVEEVGLRSRAEMVLLPGMPRAAQNHLSIHLLWTITLFSHSSVLPQKLENDFVKFQCLRGGCWRNSHREPAGAQEPLLDCIFEGEIGVLRYWFLYSRSLASKRSGRVFLTIGRVLCSSHEGGTSLPFYCGCVVLVSISTQFRFLWYRIGSPRSFCILHCFSCFV